MQSSQGLSPLRAVVAANGVVFLIRALTNLTRPTAFFVDENAPPNAVDTVHVMGITQAALGLTQLGTASGTDVRSLATSGAAAALFAAGMAVKTVTMGRNSADRFHRVRLGAAAENLAVLVLYGVVLRRLRVQRNV